MTKLDINQLDFIINTFFRTPEFGNWYNIAVKLVMDGECIIPGTDCPWTGGIGNFIKTDQSNSYIDCVKLSFDLNSFISSDNLYFKESYNEYMSKLNSELHTLNAKIESISNL